MLDLEKRAVEIRKTLIQTVSQTGGHLASNLGVVELTLALHHVFDFSQDKILFDVGHQSYVHKLVTDREQEFSTLRTRGGVGPFSDPSESSWDHFISGHAGTALAAAVGIAKAYPEKQIVVIVGDASIANGHSMEALNYIGGEKIENILVILNDNGMSIGRNVGSLSKFLRKVMLSSHYLSLRNEIRAFVDKIQARAIKDTLERMEISVKNFLFPSNVAENFGYIFLGTIDGHNIKELVDTLSKAKKRKGPLFLHVKTVKGKGYKFAEKNTEKFHGIAPFDLSTGSVVNSSESYSSIFGNKIKELSGRDERVFAITAGMLSGTGLKKMADLYPERVLDTGIAEGFAATMAAGLAISGKKPYLCIYSTFLQRSFSQIVHDVSIQNLPVRFIIDRAGIVGEDGKTHHGLHDLSFLLSIPNIMVLNPTTKEELEQILDFSLEYQEGPLAIRIPRDRAYSYPDTKKWEFGKWQEIQSGKNTLFIAVGSMLKEILDLKLSGTTIVAAASLRPLDKEYIKNHFSQYKNIIVCEENYKEASFFQYLLNELDSMGIQRKIDSISLRSFIIGHGQRKELLEEYGLSGAKLLRRIEEIVNGGKE